MENRIKEFYDECVRLLSQKSELSKENYLSELESNLSKFCQNYEENHSFQFDEKYKKIFEKSSDGISVISVPKNTGAASYIEVNNQYCTMVGYNQEELFQMPAQRNIKEQPNILKTIKEELLLKGEAIYELTLITKNGNELPVEFNSRTIENKNEIIILSVVRDISQRKNIERALIESEKRYQHITESITDYIIKVFVENGKAIKTLHGAACLIVTGYRIEEYEKDEYLWFKMIYEDDRKNVREKLANILQGIDNKAFEHRIYYKNGSIRWIRNNPVIFKDNDGEICEYDAIISDVTDLKTVELKVLENEKQYRLLFNEMNSGCALHEMIFDQNGNSFDYRFIEVNPAFESIIGFKKEDIISKSVKEIMPETEYFWIERYGSVAQTGLPLKFEDYSKVLDKYFDVTAYCPKKGFFAIVVNDISERKQTEAGLTESEEKYRKLVWTFPDAICIYSQRKLIYVNKSGIKLIGARSADEIIGTDIMQFVHPDYHDLVIERFEKPCKIKKFHQ